ncbi:MAG: DinB family protein [Thermoanaerobaculia bacterium]
MTISTGFLSDYDFEMAGTRRALERVPLERYDWMPHPKSFSLGRLSNHLVGLQLWARATMASHELDLLNPGFERTDYRTTEALVAGFDAELARVRSAIAAASDEEMLTPWTLRRGDQLLFTLPRAAVLKGMVLHHTIHHRGQLTVYLRLLDVPVPGLYGPSADEV